MATVEDYPLLVLPEPRLAPKDPATRRGGGASVPSKERQIVRLEPQFLELQKLLDQRGAALSSVALGVDPDYVLVFETIGPPQDFFEAVAAQPDLEWLLEQEDRVAQDEDFRLRRNSSAELTACIYMLAANHRALEQVLSLWNTYKAGPMPSGFGGWGAVFRCLRSIRKWGPVDRLRESDRLRDWLEPIDDSRVIPVELELWSRSAEQRELAEKRIRKLVAEAGGKVLHSCVIAEIKYHGVLAHLPRAYVERLLEVKDVELVQADEIYLVRAVPQAGVEVETDSGEPSRDNFSEPSVRKSPVCAMLDGLPMENHPALRGRLVVDDNEDWAATYPVASRKHGTAMASLIVHGDLVEQQPIQSPLLVSPILRPGGNQEHAPRDQLWIDLIHRSVVRLLQGKKGSPPTAPTVKVINLSVGDAGRPFVREMSPVARLLDWLAWKYQVLFVVSAGNHRDIEFQANTPDDVSALRQLHDGRRQLRLLCPAESVNALTVGSLNCDGANALLREDQAIFPRSPNLPAAYSAQGRGHRRAVKPELLAPGGRQIFRKKVPMAGQPWVPERLQKSAGIQVAVPSATGPVTAPLIGTSASAAIVSHHAVRIAEQLDMLAAEHDFLLGVPRAILIKALLVHTADWPNEAFSVVKQALHGRVSPSSQKDHATAFLGYGLLRPTRALGCEASRATAVGGGVIGAGQRLVHPLPIAECLHTHRGWRRLTVTVAWLTPINPADRRYRKARVALDVPELGKCPLNIAASQVHSKATERGTLQHVVFEGDESAMNIGEHETLDLPIACSEDAPKLDEPIPYAMVASLEVAPETGLRVYEQVAARIGLRERVIL